MATGLLLLLDDIASFLDDVATLTKVTVGKTAGVLGDDLALNAQQVSGVEPGRELPIVWAVAKGSTANKGILVPAALGLSYFAPWAINPLMVIGGTYLCYEGCEKIAHAFLHSHSEDEAHQAQHKEILATEEIDVVQAEREKIRGAVRTDFILSAEIIVISLGIVSTAPLMTQVLVLVGVAVLMTVGVYGLVAAIVKLDDLGAYLVKTPGLSNQIGRFILASAPYLMKFLSIAGTAAMFFVGGGIVVHQVEFLHHAIEPLSHFVAKTPIVGSMLETLTKMILEGGVGIICGSIVLAIVLGCKSVWSTTTKKA